MAQGWEAINGAMAIARREIAALAPDAEAAAEGEAYAVRVLTACLNDAFLGHVMVENGLSRALPVRGGPNLDYRMVFAGLDAARHYKLEGQLKHFRACGRRDL